MRKRKNRPTMTPSIWWMVGMMALITVFPYLCRNVSPTSPKQISWNEFELRMLDRNAVDSIEVVNNEYADVYIRKQFADDPYFRNITHPVGGKPMEPGPHYRFNIGSVDVLEKKLDEAQQNIPAAERIKIDFSRRSSSLVDLLSWLAPLLLLFLVFRWLMRGAAGGIPGGGFSPFNFGQSTAAKQTDANQSMVTFRDVAGMTEAKQEVMEVVDFLKAPERYTKLGAKIPRGVIIVGPPGTGKTLLAKAVAGEAKVPFFNLSGSEFVEMFVGVGASRVRDLFRRAKETAPSIIFIDEIDAVGRSRSRNAMFTGGNDERESTLNQLLTEMDGFGTNSGVIVLAATNRADMLDPALLRPGRFDRHVYLELPDPLEREAIFNVHLRPVKLDKTGVDAAMLAAQTPGFSGADIANICNEAALFAARRKSDIVEKKDFLDAIERIVAGGLEKKNKIISPEEKRVIAYHEAGHAVVSWYLMKVDPLIKVSVIPRGKSLGAAWYLPEERQIRTAAAFTEMICASLGGRAAEDLIFGEVSSGALDDLQKVTREAYSMVAYYGFDQKIGPVSFYDSTGGQETAFQKPYSEATGRMIDDEVRQLVTNAYQNTIELLRKHRGELEALASILLQKEVVYKEDLEKILGKRGAPLRGSGMGNEDGHLVVVDNGL